jgi:signal transduction histidine kinase
VDDVWNGEHLRRVRTWLFDGGIAGSVLYVTLMERGLEPAVVAIGLVMAVAMLGRRRYPVVVACVVYTAAPLHLLFDDAMRLYDVAVLISMFAVVKYRPQLVWGILAGVGAGLGVVIGAAVEARKTDNFGTITWVIGALTVAVWFSAYGVRTRRLYVASLEERAATLERERDHLARLAAADERAAIARELHDVVAHSLSVMIVQADGAGFTLDPSAAHARQALDTIAATGRDALEDMRRVVSVLRGASPGADGASRRRVGLAELDRLVERAGLRVALDTVGTPAGLSVAEELTAYRIVQESLTNTLRHAGPDAKVTLRLECTTDHVAIEATDDGGGRPTPAATGPGGHGLVGMRERVALHGGTVTAGPRFDGGWTVRATIPRAPQSTAIAAPGPAATAKATPPSASDTASPAPDHTSPAPDHTSPAPDRANPAPDRAGEAVDASEVVDRASPAADRISGAVDRVGPVGERGLTTGGVMRAVDTAGLDCDPASTADALLREVDAAKSDGGTAAGGTTRPGDAAELASAAGPAAGSVVMAAEGAGPAIGAGFGSGAGLVSAPDPAVGAVAADVDGAGSVVGAGLASGAGPVDGAASAGAGPVDGAASAGAGPVDGAASAGAGPVDGAGSAGVDLVDGAGSASAAWSAPAAVSRSVRAVGGSGSTVGGGSRGGDRGARVAGDSAPAAGDRDRAGDGDVVEVGVEGGRRWGVR